jgi:type VII secretion integral membrane protein EccD
VSEATDLCRVTLVAQRGRFDIALPAAVPLAYLLPTLLRQSGADLADAGVGHGGWAVQRLGGVPFDTGQSAATLGIHDGEVLYLRPRRKQLPPPVFDDVVEAIGWTLAERTHRWNAAATRAAGLAATGVLLGAGLGLLLLSGPPWRIPATVAGLTAAVLLVGAAMVSRALGSATAAALLGCAAAPYAFLAGLFGMVDTRPLDRASGPGMIAGGSLALITLLLAFASVGGAEPVFVAAGLTAAILFASGLVAGYTSPAGVAAVAIGLVFVLGPAVPAIAYRLARLPAPFLPTSAEDLRRGATTLPAQRISERSVVADRYVTALLAGGALVIAAATPFLATAAGFSPTALAGLAAVLALLRMRLFSGRAQRIWLLGAALSAAGGCVIVLATHLADRAARAGVSVLVLVAALLVVGVAIRPERQQSPPRGRLLDIIEIVVAVATIPLVLSVLGVYSYVRSLAG